MFDYLEKFNSLAKDLRDKVSTQKAISVINGLEEKYGVDLATLVMKVMIKEVAIDDLAVYFVGEFNLSEDKARELVDELKEKVFFGLTDYLGIEKKTEKKEKPTINSMPAGSEVSPAQKDEPEIKPMHAKSEVKPAQRDSFFFSAEDEEEIRELTQRISEDVRIGLFNGEVEDSLDNIIRKAKINFGSEELLDRFKQILKTYLRGIRDKIETKQTLIKSFTAGGLNFDQESAGEILLIADEIIKELRGLKQADKIKPPGKIKIPPHLTEEKELKKDKQASLKGAGVRDIDYDFSQLNLTKDKVKGKKEARKVDQSEKIELKKKTEQPSKELDTGHEIAPPPPAIRQVAKASAEVTIPTKEKPVKKTEDTSEKASEITPKPRPVQAKEIKSAQPTFQPTKTEPANIRRPAETAGKVKMEDVKFVPKVMGPIDELKYMNLVNFRRLGQDPAKIAVKIKEKIRLLEDESYAQRIKGVKAWRSSPVNKLYLLMGQACVSQNKSIDVIIEERKAAGQKYLTSQEFKAIMDLNKSLRF